MSEHGLPVIALFDPREDRHLEVIPETATPVFRFQPGGVDELEVWLENAQKVEPWSRLEDLTEQLLQSMQRVEDD